MEFQVTHPFPPWHGRRFLLSTRKNNWGEDRLMFFDDAGRLRSLQASWTDVDEPDLFTQAAGGRSFLRTDDLAALARLLDEIEQAWKRADGVKDIAPQV